MNPSVSSRPAGRLTRLGLALAFLVVARPVAAAVPADSRKLSREITVIEKVMDDMLLDSKNLLVYATDHNAHGLYLDEFGVVFSFNASLVILVTSILITS